MEKIKLKDGTILNLVPMGIQDNKKRRRFTFFAELTNIEEIFTEDNISRIEYLSVADEVLAVYVDCVSLKLFTKDIENGTYTVELSLDDLERKIKTLQETVDTLVLSELEG